MTTRPGGHAPDPGAALDDDGALVYRAVSVANRPAVDFCLDPAGRDPVAGWMLDHGRIDEPVMRAFLSFISTGSRVLDLGSHLGTFALPAAAAGAKVIAIDASVRHADLLRRAARRNGLDHLQVEHGAISGADEPVAVVGRSIHTRLALAGEHADARTVPSVSIDALLRARGWDGVDVVKIDVEGNEPAALNGMRETFGRGRRPVIVLECNGGLLPLFGSSPAALRRALERLGYRLFQIDHLQPGRLVPTDADAVQSECVVDLLALPPGGVIPPEWETAPPFTRQQVVCRLLDQAASPSDGYRRYAAQTIAAGPEWLRSDPLVAPAARALALDLAEVVRTAIGASEARAGWQDGAPLPELGGAPAELALFVSGLALERPSAEPDRPVGTTPRSEDILVRDGALYARRGHMIGVLDDDALAGGELLRCIAGRRRPLGGAVHVAGRAVLIADIAAVLEPDLSVRENAIFYGAFLGVDARAARRDIDELLALSGLADVPDELLRACSVDGVLRLVFAVALLWGQPDLLLIDRLPTCGDERFRSWLAGQVAHLRAGGGAIVQVVADPSLLVAPVDRMLWLSESRFAACGHPASVADAWERSALDLWSAAPPAPSLDRPWA